MNIVERLEAVGERGEACIILKEMPGQSADSTECAPNFKLATGERLKFDPDRGGYSTSDGSRTYKLRGVRTED